MTRPVRARVVLGHVLDGLRLLPERSVQCVVTSPPYWGLRDYGTAEWEGGDPACLHLRTESPRLVYGVGKTRWQHANNGDELAKALGMDAGSARAVTDDIRQRPIHPASGAVCADCGAARVEPTVWGGNPDCPHEWAGILTPAANGIVSGAMSGDTLNEDSATRRPRLSASCGLCGAWRGALGLEPTPELYVEHMVEVFREVRRVLRDDGTLWLNMGDCYASPPSWGRGGGSTLKTPSQGEVGGPPHTRGVRTKPNTPHGAVGKGAGLIVPDGPNRAPLPGLKPKDLVGMPWRVAFALQADGWWLRSDVVWSKPNPMPESVADRPTRSHEFVFLLAKGERYFCDMDAIREPFAEGTYKRILQEGFDEQEGGPKDYAATGIDPSRSSRRGLENLAPKVREAFRAKTAETPHLGGRRQAPEPGEPDAFHPLGRNKRTVWEIATEPFPEAHFATFPQALVLPMILAGTSERGCCPECGAPWRRVVEAEGGTIGRDWNQHARGDADLLIGHTKDDVAKRAAKDGTYRRFEVGWEPGCGHPDAAEPVPCIVLDPFVGSGTTLFVAAKNGRDSVGLELKEDYLRLILGRLAPMEADLINPVSVGVERASGGGEGRDAVPAVRDLGDGGD